MECGFYIWEHMTFKCYDTKLKNSVFDNQWAFVIPVNVKVTKQSWKHMYLEIASKHGQSMGKYL